MAHLALSLAGSVVVAGGTCLVVAAIGGTEQLDPVRVALESSGMFLGVSASALVLGADRGVALFGGALLASLAVQQRFPTWGLYPMAPEDPTWARAGVVWAAIATVSGVAVAAASRDPFARRYRAGCDT